MNAQILREKMKASAQKGMVKRRKILADKLEAERDNNRMLATEIVGAIPDKIEQALAGGLKEVRVLTFDIDDRDRQYDPDHQEICCGTVPWQQTHFARPLSREAFKNSFRVRLFLFFICKFCNKLVDKLIFWSNLLTQQCPLNQEKIMQVFSIDVNFNGRVHFVMLKHPHSQHIIDSDIITTRAQAINLLQRWNHDHRVSWSLCAEIMKIWFRKTAPVLAS